MNTKWLMILAAAALLTAYAWTRPGGAPGDGLALAGVGAGMEQGRGLVAVTTGAPGGDANRLILVDTVKKRLAVYKINHKALGLIALRSYNYDMKIDDSAALPGQDFSYESIRQFVMASALPEERKKSPPAGREMVLTTDGAGLIDANRIILVNPEEKRVVVYRLNGNQLLLVAARRYDEDFVPEYIPGMIPGDGYSRETISRARERNEAGEPRE
ncbi:MAG TPA: hypothetical protein PK280_20600 [Planctomycetota bacterium]|nr:hypothetical protein [Planctomycetota bacterium]